MTISPLYGAKSIDLCNGEDPLCSNGSDVAARSLYGQAGLAAQAADFAAQQLTAPLPAATVQQTAGQVAARPRHTSQLQQLGRGWPRRGQLSCAVTTAHVATY
jgi:hypothetical protein